MKQAQIKSIRNYVHSLFDRDNTGHDFFHMCRVAHMAEKIAQTENANPFICEVSGWLHDVGDPKLFSNPKEAILKMVSFLQSIELTNNEVTQIQVAIENVSFSKGRIPGTIEGKIVQDADRLDAIGAIGIARTFAYGGANDQQIHHDMNPKNTTIQHFHDKLLMLSNQMNTKLAQEIATERHQFMELFLSQFYQEWKHE